MMTFPEKLFYYSRFNCVCEVKYCYTYSYIQNYFSAFIFFLRHYFFLL